MSSPKGTTSRELRSLLSSEMYGLPSLEDGSVYIGGLRCSARLKRKQYVLQMPLEPPTKKPTKSIDETEPIAPIPCKSPSFVCSTPKRAKEPFPGWYSSDQDSDAANVEDVNLSESGVNIIASRSGYEGHIFSVLQKNVDQIEKFFQQCAAVGGCNISYASRDP